MLLEFAEKGYATWHKELSHPSHGIRLRYHLRGLSFVVLCNQEFDGICSIASGTCLWLGGHCARDFRQVDIGTDGDSPPTRAK